MMHITNNPELSTAFQNDEVKLYLRVLLRELDENPYALKSLLKKGHEETYNEIIGQLSKSFVPVKHHRTEKDVYLAVKRCIDGITFHVGDLVKYKSYGTPTDQYSERNLPIGRLYSDDRGLHVQLKVDDKGTITWRDLSLIDHVDSDK